MAALMCTASLTMQAPQVLHHPPTSVKRHTDTQQGSTLRQVACVLHANTNLQQGVIGFWEEKSCHRAQLRENVPATPSKLRASARILPHRGSPQHTHRALAASFPP